MMSSWFPYGGVGPYGSYSNLGLYGALVTYGSLSLTETSPAQSFVEPFTLSQIKSYLKVPERSPADEAEDNDLTSFIIGARVQAEILQNRDLVVKQYDLSHDYWPNYYIELRDPLRSVDLVQYRDSNGEITAMVENTDFIVDSSKGPGVLMPPYNKTWPTFTPWPSSAILVRFTSGYAADSAFWAGDGHLIKNGMKLLISAWYNQRLPFEVGRAAALEYPYAVTNCLSHGALVRAR
jgi:uncharacterized phiE125 gp8 family phage protein